MMQERKKAKLTLGHLLGNLCSGNDEAAEPSAKLCQEVEHQIQRYQDDDGLKLLNDEGGYNCPLVWWRDNLSRYSYIWGIAERVLHIPATSAPSERVFSQAAKIISKKRSRLTPENASTLIFLKENDEYAYSMERE